MLKHLEAPTVCLQAIASNVPPAAPEVRVLLAEEARLARKQAKAARAPGLPVQYMPMFRLPGPLPAWAPAAT